MKSSSCRGLEVFDFKEEDELPEVSASKYLGKFKDPNSDDLALKCDFLTYAVAPASNILRTETGGMPCVDVDELDGSHPEDDCTSNTVLGMDHVEYATKLSSQRVDSTILFDPLDNGRQNSDRIDNEECRNLFPMLETRTASPGAPSPIKGQSDHAHWECLSEESVDLNSNADDDGIDERASSSFTSDNGEDVLSNGQDTKDHARDMEMDYMNGIMHVFPEYAIYRENYYVEPRISFSSSSIKIEASSTCRKEKKNTLEWPVDDVVKICCHWLQKVQTVYLKIHVISKDAACDDYTQGAAGIEELKFAVVDPYWFEKQEMIKTFNSKYSAVWELITDAGSGMERIDSSGHRPYFPTFDEPFEDFIYPKGDSDAVSLSKRDVDLLQPETFVNDTIIDFYIKYLKNRIQPEEKHRFHFFNSFFFRKLADMDKDPSSAADGRAAFLRVRKWTRKINLFKKDYIFIPVNFNLHWSLIVICHPGEVASISEEKISTPSKVPCILHMDSIKGSHAGLKNLVQSYLWEEWKEKGNEISEEISLKFSNFRFVSLELPQQENSYDCGLFLLHYLELFLQEAPCTFNPFGISRSSKFLNVDWFLPVEASLKRSVIQRLIYELLEGHSREVSGSASSKENKSSKILECKNENGLGMDNVSGKCSSVIACSSASAGGKGIEVGLLADPLTKSSQNVTESGLVLREFFEAGAAVDSFPGPCQSLIQPSYYHLNGAMTAIKAEDAEMDEQIAFVPESTGPSGETEFHEFRSLTTQAEGVSCPTGCFESKASWEHGIALPEQHKSVHSPGTSNCVSDNSQGVGIVENDIVKEDSNHRQKCEMDGQRSHQAEKVEGLLENLASPSGVVPKDVIVDVSQDYDKMCHHDDEEGGNTGCCQERQPMSHQDPNVSESMLHPDGGDLCYRSCDDTNMLNPGLQQSADIAGTVEIASDAIAISDDQEEPEKQPDAKRPRLTPREEDEVGLKENMSEDLRL